MQAKTLESTIGHLTHLALVIPGIHHFLSRLCNLLWIAKRWKWVPITPHCMEDRRLMKSFLTQARKGLSLNIIAYQCPDWIYYSDSCPFDLRGFSSAGLAWRMILPAKLLFCASVNLLEHIALIISPWIDMIKGRCKPRTVSF